MYICCHTLAPCLHQPIATTTESANPAAAPRGMTTKDKRKGNIDYLGWVGKQDQDNGDDVNLVSVAFAWADDDPEAEVKPMSTSKRSNISASIPSHYFAACSAHGRLASPLALSRRKLPHSSTRCFARDYTAKNPLVRPPLQCSLAAASSGKSRR